MIAPGRPRALGPAVYGALAVFVCGGSLLLAYEGGSLAPVLAFGAAVAVALALTAPMVALHLAVALVPLELFSLRLGGTASISPAEGMFALAGVAWAVRRLAAGQPLLTASPLNLPFGLILLAIAAGFAVGEDTVTVAKVLVMWTAFVLAYLMVLAEGTPKTVRSLLMVLVASGTVVAGTALVRGDEQELLELGTVATGRATGSFAQPNILATFLVLALPPALALTFAVRPARRTWPAVAFGVILAGLALSLSRGGFLAAAVALAVMLAWRPVRNIAALASVLLLVLTVAGANPVVGTKEFRLVAQRIESISYTSTAETESRGDIWSKTPQIFEEHPLFGVGAGRFFTVAPQYGVVSVVGDPFDHAHNIPLTIAAELGIVGLIGLVWAALALLVLLTRAWRRSEGAERGISLCLAAGLAGFAVHGVVDYTLRTNVITALFFLFAACSVIMARPTRP